MAGLLPHKTEHWPAILRERRESYAAWHRELRIDPRAREEIERTAPVEETVDHVRVLIATLHVVSSHPFLVALEPGQWQ